MSEIEKLQGEIEKLKKRNKRVDTNKAWETSLTRKIILMVLTYAVITITFVALKNPDPYTNAVIPTIAFFLSTLTLPFVKYLWERYLYKNEK